MWAGADRCLAPEIINETESEQVLARLIGWLDRYPPSTA